MIWNNITIVEIFDSLYDNFEITIVLLLYFGDKNLKEIPQIVTSTKAVNMVKRAIGQIVDLTIMATKRTDSHQ